MRSSARRYASFVHLSKMYEDRKTGRPTDRQVFRYEGRERETDSRERQTDRPTETDRQTQIDRGRQTETERQRQTQASRHVGR